MPLAPHRPKADRLAEEYYTAVRVPPDVAALASVPDTLAPGSPAKVGILDLAFAVRGGRTELVGRYQKTPLQIMRPLWIDPEQPGMSYVYLMATGGGVAQADRYRMDFHCGPDTQVHLTTQAATKIFRMEHDYASQRVHLTAGAGSYVEYLPDPLIPFQDARFYQSTEVTVAPDATVLVGDTLTAGRLARGERHSYRALATDLRIRRPDGTLLAIDTLRLTPGRPGTGVLGPGVFAGHDHVASLFAVTDRVPATELADTLHEALAGLGVLYGVSVLPRDCGAWVRLLDDSPVRVAEAHRAAWHAVRRLLTGHPPPDLRKP
ncbi:MULTISPECIES: urease accessory protein UreD [unclassified Streptomyces]|uniref:urease accessory protein UreD n=1 Tax=unclassified Streptomyces TaxID=2593676 RepID=UPI002E2BAC57|nr:urease accessory protein UreD [Streptomyces sp. NBC_01423]WSX94681.1 urease accessory protein UreD [Streptomyces sp. NBC_00891]WSY09161.1 urease accessory protein UreD [Streptomyces sp. NBC_00890]WSZ10783.1 urease accessory protein UreD [Streptomyces sp. NBC_00869]WSZ21713.1 urease accessory protein UreD [Streptomyces sp. NBC_00870]